MCIKPFLSTNVNRCVRRSACMAIRVIIVSNCAALGRDRDSITNNVVQNMGISFAVSISSRPLHLDLYSTKQLRLPYMLSDLFRYFLRVSENWWTYFQLCFCDGLLTMTNNGLRVAFECRTWRLYLLPLSDSNPIS